MIRPIKLRAKTTDGDWATGDLCFNGVEPPQIIWLREDSEVIEADIFDHATIGMYTGIRIRTVRRYAKMISCIS